MSGLLDLTKHHIDNCKEYKSICLQIKRFSELSQISKIENIPFLPAALFKKVKLRSVPENDIYKTLYSSGTSSQIPSMIPLDKKTALAQTKALASIVQSFTGKKRLPMIIVDTPSTVKNTQMFSARATGITGFSIFGRDHFYLLDDSFNIKFEEFKDFLKKHNSENNSRQNAILFFGFTSLVWKHIVKALLETGYNANIKNGILIHGGGWKKMQEQSVGRDEFKQSVKKALGNVEVYNYYGMVEQVGSIFMECEYGHLHTPDFADVIVRNPSNFEILPHNHKGLLQVLSLLPTSYPGHSILTEDLGTILGEDDCKCSRKGKYFLVHSRLPAAELRGCSDTGISPTKNIQTLSDHEINKIEKMFNLPTLPPYDERAKDFCSHLSKKIFEDKNASKDPGMAFLASWLRPASIHKMENDFFADNSNDYIKKARGTVLHFTPVNIQTMFVYSWILSLLAGNNNIVRLSTKASQDANLLTQIIFELLERDTFRFLSERNIFVKYAHDDQINCFLSKNCHTRIIWGSDITVEKIRQYPLLTCATELVFPDRFSAAMLKAESVACMNNNQILDLAEKIYADSMMFNQQACSCVKAILWSGNTKTAKAQSKKFWEAFKKIAATKDSLLSPAERMVRYAQCCYLAPLTEIIIDYDDFCVISLDKLTETHREEHKGNGMFYECFYESEQKIAQSLTNKDQTIVAHGFSTEQLNKFMTHISGKAVDRIVEPGQALTFSNIWDGYDIQTHLIRKIKIQGG